MIKHDDIKHDTGSVVHVGPSTVVFPDNALSGSICMDRTGLVHLADVSMRRWWMSRWVPAVAFLLGVALGAVLVWGVG